MPNFKKKTPEEEEMRLRIGLTRGRTLLQGRDPHQIVALARRHTVQALLVLVKLMNGEGPSMPVVRGGEPVFDEKGGVKKMPAPVPPQVQMRAAEIILERGYGKSPQAILVKGDDTIPGGIHAIPIMERIAMIAQARSQLGQTTDLEASEQDESAEIPDSTIDIAPAGPGRPALPPPERPPERPVINPQDVI